MLIPHTTVGDLTISYYTSSSYQQFRKWLLSTWRAPNECCEKVNTKHVIVYLLLLIPSSCSNNFSGWGHIILASSLLWNLGWMRTENLIPFPCPTNFSGIFQEEEASCLFALCLTFQARSSLYAQISLLLSPFFLVFPAELLEAHI